MLAIYTDTVKQKHNKFLIKIYLKKKKIRYRISDKYFITEKKETDNKWKKERKKDDNDNILLLSREIRRNNFKNTIQRE